MSLPLLDRILSPGFEGKRRSPQISSQFLLALLGYYKNDKEGGKCCPGEEKLIVNTRSSESTVRRHLGHLIVHRYVEVDPDKSKYPGTVFKSRYYRILEPGDANAQLPPRDPAEVSRELDPSYKQEVINIPEGLKEAPRQVEAGTPSNWRVNETERKSVIDTLSLKDLVRRAMLLACQGKLKVKELNLDKQAFENVINDKRRLKVYAEVLDLFEEYYVFKVETSKVGFLLKMLKDCSGDRYREMLESYRQGARRHAGEKHQPYQISFTPLVESLLSQLENEYGKLVITPAQRGLLGPYIERIYEGIAHIPWLECLCARWNKANNPGRSALDLAMGFRHELFAGPYGEQASQCTQSASSVLKTAEKGC